MNPFDLLRVLAHIEALQADWKVVQGLPEVAKLIADAKLVASDLKLDEKFKALMASMETKS